MKVIGVLADRFREVWLVDFEFQTNRGGHPWIVCMVARELRSGREVRFWRDDLLTLRGAPFDVGPDALFVAYAATAEIGCMLELGWPVPCNVLDLYFEFRAMNNGRSMPHGNGIIGALAQYGLPHIGAGEKQGMRELVISRRDWSLAERQAILDYCGSDVDALAALLPAMSPQIDWPRALLRGRYASAVARMERSGIPIDRCLYDRVVQTWDRIKLALIRDVDASYGVYEGASFKQDAFARFLARQDIAWPRTRTGRLTLDDDTFRDRARCYPMLLPLRELRRTLDEMRAIAIPVGGDGRARCPILPFASVTGRNQPRSSEFVFWFSKWVRGLIRASQGSGVAYVDWAAQENAIAAALSGDERMIDHYRSGDPYLAFGKQVGLAPPDATPQSHGPVRDQCKAVLIAVTYGMGADALATSANVTRAEASELLRLHRATYPRFHRWIEDTVSAAMLTNEMHSVFGWRRRITGEPNPRSLANFPMQANGAEMMRVGAIASTEAGIEVCAPVHDAFLIAAPLDRLDDDVVHMQEIMTKAGRVVTGNLDVRTEAEVVRWPDRFMPEGGEQMFNRVMELLAQVEVAP